MQLLSRAGFHAGRREVLKRGGGGGRRQQQQQQQGGAPPRRLTRADDVSKRASSFLERRRGPDGAHASRGIVGDGACGTGWSAGHARLSPPPATSSSAASSTEEESPSIARGDRPISLAELVDALPPLLRAVKEDAARRSQPSSIRATTLDEARGAAAPFDPVMDLFGRLDLGRRVGDDDDVDDVDDDADERRWWNRYAHPDPTRDYTRNLIATDDETYTLLLLCWNPGMSSPIHDHPCDGCWVRVCEGKIRETRYEVIVGDDDDDGGDGAGAALIATSDALIEDSAPTFINDSVGYHRVGNPCDARVAVTLHLYCPPVRECRVWHDPADASRPSVAVMRNHTEYGIRVNVNEGP
ncbi:hypothetical protein ACHAW5_008535 [Stephanodiscus triporus]|uniref:cysteine dioxygenase n=1 Tax=Stephanodiscus triporus TaxID=2934178 RepID=A0ABD3NL93_9STRA